jgi:hypothetical protein
MMGRAEVAEWCAVRPMTVDKWRQRGVLYRPDSTISGSPCWEPQTLQLWAHMTGRRPFPDPAGDAAAVLRAADKPTLPPGGWPFDGRVWTGLDRDVRDGLWRIRKSGGFAGVRTDRESGRLWAEIRDGGHPPRLPLDVAVLPDPLALIALLEPGEPVEVQQLVWALDAAYDVSLWQDEDDLDEVGRVAGSGLYVGMSQRQGSGCEHVAWAVTGWLPLIALATGWSLAIGAGADRLRVVTPQDRPGSHTAATGYGLTAATSTVTRVA